jgi:hypothetical protein
MSGRVETIGEQPLFWVDDCECGFGTEVRLDAGRVTSGLLPKMWRPSFCPNCGRKLTGRARKVL